MSVFSVVSATGIDPAIPVVDGGEVHKALDGATSWNDQWKAIPPPPLAQGTIANIMASPKTHLVYGRKRGRSIWFPHLFLLTGPVRKLSCYQRNLALASLQVDSLLGLMGVTDESIRSGDSLATAHWDLAKLGSDLLGRLYGGARTTYRSSSIRAQIDASDLVPAVNSVRQYFGKPPLN